MTELRKNAMELIERMPEDKLFHVVQIIQGMNGLYSGTGGEDVCNWSSEMREKHNDAGYDELEGHNGNDRDFDDFPIGILSRYANPEKRALEEGAFERAMVEKHGNG